MKILIRSLVLSFVLVAGAFAQRIGDTPATVLQVLGTPSMERETGDRQIWIYGNGTKIVFESGKVVESNAPVVASAAAHEDVVAQEKVEPEETPRPARKVLPVVRPRPAKPVAVVETTVEMKDKRASSGFGLFFVVAGVIISFVASIIILIEAFSQSVLWGVALLLFPITQLFFVAIHWQQTKRPFLSILLIGIPLTVIGYQL